MSNREESEVEAYMGDDSQVILSDPDTNSASYNISRSKQLIKTLEQTKSRSATMLQRARSFHELQKMLSVSKLMSENSKVRIKNSDRQRVTKYDKSEIS